MGNFLTMGDFFPFSLSIFSPLLASHSRACDVISKSPELAFEEVSQEEQDTREVSSACRKIAHNPVDS